MERRRRTAGVSRSTMGGGAGGGGAALAGDFSPGAAGAAGGASAASRAPPRAIAASRWTIDLLVSRGNGRKANTGFAGTHTPSHPVRGAARLVDNAALSGGYPAHV